MESRVILWSTHPSPLTQCYTLSDMDNVTLIVYSHWLGPGPDRFYAECFTLHRDQDLSRDLKIIFFVLILENISDKYYV